MKLIILPLFLFICFSINAQKKKLQLEPSYYVFDSAWKPIELEHAVYLMTVSQEPDASWRFETYRMFGPMVKLQHFKDKDGDTAHGEFIFFNEKGRQDSAKQFTNGLANGTWDYRNDTGAVFHTVEYIAGHAVKESYPLHPDSVARQLAREKADTAKKDEHESEFKGGQKAWANYLTKEIKYPDRAINSNIQGTVQVQFVVDQQGTVMNPEIYKSVEYSLDHEALRLLIQSPSWIPARQNGKIVKSYKRQPITFRLQ